MVVDNDKPGIHRHPRQVRLAAPPSPPASPRSSDATGLANLRVQIDNDPPASAHQGVADGEADQPATWKRRPAHDQIRAARDKAGNTTVLQRALSIDNKKPTVRIKSAPKNNAVLRGKVTISAAAADNLWGVERVQLLVNGKVAGTDYKAGYQLQAQPEEVRQEVHRAVAGLRPRRKRQVQRQAPRTGDEVERWSQ